MSRRNAQRSALFAASAALGALVLVLPSIIDRLRPFIDFMGAPELLRQLYYEVVVARFPMFAFIIAVLVWRAGRSPDPQPVDDPPVSASRSRLLVAASQLLSPTPAMAPSTDSIGPQEPRPMGALVAICLAQFLIPLLLFIHRLSHGSVLSYGWGWQMYS